MACIKVALLLFFAGAVAKCPPAQLLLPCYCQDTDALYAIECRSLQDMDVLVKVFQRSGDRRFTNFALYESTIMYLPAAYISSKQFENINIVNSSMTALFDAELGTDNKIRLVMLHGVRFQRGVGWELFKNAKKLAYFRSERTEIRSLGKSFVQNMNPGLEHLHLLDARVRKIYPNAFQNLRRLQHLSVTNSFVKEFTRSMFATPSNLRTINFSGNEIETLPDDLFSDSPGMRFISLKNNKISTLSQAVFGKVYDMLQEMELEDNPIQCDCSMKWIAVGSKRIVYGICDSPDDKKGRKIMDISASDLDYC